MKRNDFVEADMITVKTWEDFRDSGLLWFINTILHAFGWSLIVSVDDEHNIVDAFPARCKFRGFESRLNDIGYAKLSEYLKDNAQELYSEISQDNGKNND